MTDEQRRLVGIVGLRAVMRAAPDTPIRELMNDAISARARESAEKAARRCSGERFIVMPIVDDENRLVGILHGCLRHDTLYDEHEAWGHRHDLAA